MSRVYRDVPYHNFAHCADVTHTAAGLARCVGPKAAMSLPETFALLVAALCHDLDHPGVSNAYLVATRHGLATTYNDTSVLENRWVRVGFGFGLGLGSFPFTLPASASDAAPRARPSSLPGRHVSCLYALVASRPELDIFCELDLGAWREVRRWIIAAVLHTDMIHHFAMVSQVGRGAPWSPPAGRVLLVGLC